MHPEDFQIFLKLADGSFHPLVSANGKRRLKLIITTAHTGQKKAVFEFFAKYQLASNPPSMQELSAADNRVAVLELDLAPDSGSVSEDMLRELALSVELDLFDNLSLSVADPVSGTLKTTEVSLSEWLLSKESPEFVAGIRERRPLTPLRLIFLILFILVSVGLILFGAWFLGSRFSSLPPPPLSGLPHLSGQELLL